MPDVNSIQNLSGQFTEDDWNESFQMSSPNKYAISSSKADITLVGDIEFSKLRACIQYLLGFAYVDSSKALRRQTFAYHPVFTWTYCTSISSIECKGLPADKTQITDDPPYLDTFRPGKYARAVVTANYTALPYNVLEDDQVDYEYERFTELECQPYVEQLTIPNGMMVYDTPYDSTLDGKPIISPMARIRQEKTKLTMRWHLVPLDFICDTNGIPTKLVSIQKCVNDDTFLGYPAGTLLCEDVKIERGVFPVATDVLDQNLLMATITFNFIHFDPPRSASETSRGWQLFPSPSGLYCKAKISATSGATGFYSTPFNTFDFPSAFTHWSL